MASTLVMIKARPTCHDLSGVSDPPVSPVKDESPDEQRQTVIID